MVKKREREYTPEEAMAITLKRVTPHWYRSPPLVIGVVLPENAYPQPLDSSLMSGIWVFFFSSSTSASFDSALAVQKVWEKRYRTLGVKFICAFSGPYSYLANRREVEPWLKSFAIQSIAVWDEEQEISKSFGVEHDPGIAILHQGKIEYHSSRKGRLEGAETTLHRILRESSPGLPFWRVAKEEGKSSEWVTRFLTREGSKDLGDGKVKLVGEWRIEEDRIYTADSKAEILITAPAQHVEFVARSLSDAGDPTRVRIDSSGNSFGDTYAGKDFVVDDEGTSGVILSGPRAYSVLRDLPPNLRVLRFRFPFAKVSPVAVYGFEFSNDGQ